MGQKNQEILRKRNPVIKKNWNNYERARANFSVYGQEISSSIVGIVMG